MFDLSLDTTLKISLCSHWMMSIQLLTKSSSWNTLRSSTWKVSGCAFFFSMIRKHVLRTDEALILNNCDNVSFLVSWKLFNLLTNRKRSRSVHHPTSCGSHDWWHYLENSERWRRGDHLCCGFQPQEGDVSMKEITWT